MAVSAKTAPKAKGIDNIVVALLTERSELEKLADKMEELAPVYGEFFKRDAESVRASKAVFLIGCKIVRLGLAQPKRWGLDADVVNCIINLGIAIGSAVKTAQILNVDNRVMFSVGVAAQELGILDADIVYGIPLSATGKNIYFDRKYSR
ncbi:ferredoxin domain-containing protein [Thermogladius sp. 4427co]|uniref:ferredoxin domain-containing protein n=1 Tax=Thermogladius sp. 4427co TaxID=3450718 RepID=UPI003F7B0AFC